MSDLREPGRATTDDDRWRALAERFARDLMMATAGKVITPAAGFLAAPHTVPRALEDLVKWAMGSRKDDLMAAWRATLGTAAALADKAAKECEAANSRRGTVNQAGQFGAALLRALGDELFALRDRDPRDLDVTMAGLLGAPWPPQEGRSSDGTGKDAPDARDAPERPGGPLPAHRTPGGHAA